MNDSDEKVRSGIKVSLESGDQEVALGLCFVSTTQRVVLQAEHFNFIVTFVLLDFWLLLFIIVLFWKG